MLVLRVGGSFLTLFLLPLPDVPLSNVFHGDMSRAGPGSSTDMDISWPSPG